MRKYLILSDGHSTHTLKWAEEMKKYFDVFLLSFTSFNNDIYRGFEKNKLFALNVNISSSGDNYNILPYIVKIATIIKYINPDFINAHYITSYGFAASIIKKFFKFDSKLILSAWGSDILVTPFRKRIYFASTKYALTQADYITSDSHFMSDEILRICGKYPITFPFGVKSIPDVTIDEKNENICFSNRILNDNYNIDKIILYVAKLYSHKKNIKLYVANDGNEKEKLEKLVLKLGMEDVVKFIGFLNESEQNEMYKKCQYFFSIPKSDSTSVSLLEAMSYGCIPIVSNIPANREWVINNYNGLYFHDDLNALQLLRKKEDIFKINRNIISNNAIWRKNISKFISKIL